MEIPPTTLTELQAQPKHTFAYRLLHNPKPDVKIMHADAADTLAYGLSKNVLGGMVQGTGIIDITKLITIDYKHHPGRVFAIDAPELIHVHAPHVTWSDLRPHSDLKVENQNP